MGRTDGITVVKVHTCGSRKIVTPSLKTIVFTDNFVLHSFQFK